MCKKNHTYQDQKYYSAEKGDLLSPGYAGNFRSIRIVADGVFTYTRRSGGRSITEKPIKDFSV